MNPLANAEDVKREMRARFLGLRRSAGAGHGNPLQCSCLENPMDRGAWRPTVHGVTESDRMEAAQQARVQARHGRKKKTQLCFASGVFSGGSSNSEDTKLVSEKLFVSKTLRKYFFSMWYFNAIQCPGLFIDKNINETAKGILPLREPD